MVEPSAGARIEGKQMGKSKDVALLGLAWLVGCSGSGGSGSTVGSTGGRSDDGLPGGAVVGLLELAAPGQAEFLLQGTMPLPPGVVFADDALEPFSVLQANGRVAETQVEVVSRYADEQDGVDVVELIAKVRRPSGAHEGDRIRYEVAWDPHPSEPLSLKPELRSFFSAPGALELRCADAFGNEYSADLFRDAREQTGEAHAIRRGQLVREIRTHEILLPVDPQGGAQGTMPHMMGVHAYITHYAREDFFTLDLHVHNGMCGHDQETPIDDALQKIYFDSLDLRVPQGWHVVQAFDDPFRGGAQTEGGWRVYPLVKKFANGRMHVMPRQSQFWRRLVVTKNGARERAKTILRKENLAFCRAGTAPSGEAYYSWWNPETARYYPQSHRLPSLDHVGLEGLRAELAGEFNQVRGRVSSGEPGAYPFMSGVLGWAHPWGSQYGGDVGGGEIFLYDGVTTAASGSNDGYRLAQLMGRLYIDRQPTALYDVDGRPTRVMDWLHEQGNHGPWVPMYFFLRPFLPDSDPFGFNQAPTFQTDYVTSAGLAPLYDGDLSGYMPIDFQHWIRYTRHLKTLAWLGNDSMAKDELEMAAELFRLSFHEFRNSNYDHIQNSGLLAKMIHVADRPGQGVDIGRGESWGLDAALAAYATGTDEFRERYYPWFKKVMDVVVEGQSTCTGCIMSSPKDSILGGLYRVRQSYETAITENMIRGLKETVFAGHSENRSNALDQVIAKSVYASVSPTYWNAGAAAPWQYVAVAPIAGEQVPYCDDIPSNGYSETVDRYQYWSSFAYAYEVTGDEHFLNCASQMEGGAGLLDEMLAEGIDNIGNRAGLLALMQTLNGMN